MNEKDKKPAVGQERRDYDYSRCPKHNISYPKGGSCPKCDTEGK
jgi:hypothetical protein